MHSARRFLEWWASGPANVERREDIAEWSHLWVTGARKGRGDMGLVENRMRFGEGTRPAIYFAILAAVLILPAVLLLAFPARALADADLSITKQGPSRVEPGKEFDYLLNVSNQGADAATNIQVKDELPSGVTLVDYEAPAGVICSGVSIVTCNGLNLDAGKSKTITLTVKAPANVGVIENQATASAAEDPNSPKASNKVTTTVAPNLVIEKLDDPDPVDTEDVLLYTLRVENVGDTVANGVTVRDELPLDKVDFVTVDSADFKCEYKAGIVKCFKGTLGSGKIAKVEIVVEPEKAGTLQNTGAVFVQGISKALDTDTESTKVNGGGDGPNGPGGPTGPGGPNVPQGDQCSPVEDLETGEPVGVLSGTDPVEATFTNFFNDTLPLRIAYATSSPDGSLTITLTRQDNGKTVLDKTIAGKKKGVEVVDTEAGVSYDFAIVPDNQGYAVQLQIGSGEDPCTDPNDLDPPAIPGGDDGNGSNNTGNGPDDVIDDTISDNPLPNTGGPSLPGLAVITLGLAVLGGATVVRTGVRRRDR
jgi:uncharacterized repeat protein (TIGR01451 family)